MSKYTLKQHLEDVINWVKSNQELMGYSADTASTCLSIAYERWYNQLPLLSEVADN